jgi:NAD(P)-dependent dehydrogenase (short-subunit alcohol dehydrogenase family)
MEIRLDGKTALVTGASRGIGEAIARALAGAGASVMLSSRKQEALEETAAGIDGDVAVFAANAGEPDQAQACVTATVERFGSVDILVNNAATNPYMGPALGIDLPRYDKTMQVNLRGPLVWTQAAWEASMKEHGGVVLNMASVGGLVSEPLLGIYNVTKAGLIHLTRTLALDMAPGVRVNALAPGVVKTDFARALWEPFGDQMAASLPLRRIGQPDDIANAALFLCSDLASWITGQVLVIDGGAMIRPSVN